jgi:leucyl aminopeptidase
MAGGAACLAVIDIAAQLKMAVELDVYIPATDNMIDAKAEVPGNVIRSRSGKTVEIISTDAEGRLILADAISYAVDKKPDYLIDLATLTGCVLYALGEKYTAILGNNQKLVEKYISASKLENEPAWQLPLAKEYKRGIKDGIADLKNSAKTKADTIAGGLFLQEFVGDTKWMHLDIAESAWTEDGRGYYSEGATGSPIRTLVRMLEGF